MTITNEQARRFMLLKQGLWGKRRFLGKDGALAFVRQAGCIQFDPIDICGRNADLVLQSRVKGYRASMLFDLLYQDRRLVDYFDKNLAIFPVEDWPYFARTRDEYREKYMVYPEIVRVKEAIRRSIREQGPVCSADLGMDQTILWHWSQRSKLSRAALETMYFQGELVIHHKQGTKKYYALAEDCLPEGLLAAPEPNPQEEEYLAWHVLRRVQSVGLLWNRPSDAWLCVHGLKAGGRDRAFAVLLAQGKILELSVEGCAAPLYCASADRELLRQAMEPAAPGPRVELLAPLDNLLWDRRLIEALFGFSYKWEIYTPQAQRRFGYYVLPILSGDRLIGRVEPVRDGGKRTLRIAGLWLEDGVKLTKTLRARLERAFGRLAALNGCTEVEWRSK